MRLSNKVAIVTGASRGMGAETALLMAREGADVVLAARSMSEPAADKTRPGTISNVAEQIRLMGRRALPVRTDVSVKEDVENLVATTIREFGQIDILVQSAWFVNFSDVPLSDLLDESLTLATLGTFRGLLDLTRAVLPHMRKRKYGKIINITSVGAKNKAPHCPVYAGLKAAVAHFSSSLADIVASEGITVNCVAPGIIDTKSTFECMGNLLEPVMSIIPMKRLGKEIDVAQAVLFLADDVTSNYITGTTISVDGGLSQF